MGLLLSKADVRKIVREELQALALHVLQPLSAQLTDLNTKIQNIMATQQEIATELAAKTAQIRKAIDEVTTRLAALEEAVRNAPATPELTAAVAALGAAVQAADDIVPDAPPEPAP